MEAQGEVEAGAVNPPLGRGFRQRGTGNHSAMRNGMCTGVDELADGRAIRHGRWENWRLALLGHQQQNGRLLACLLLLTYVSPLGLTSKGQMAILILA